MAEKLLDDANHLTGANGTATFADSELQTGVHSNGSDELHGDLHVIARHHHLDTVREEDLTGNIQGADEELGTIVIVERGVTTTFFLLQHIDLSLELGVGSDGLGLGNNLRIKKGRTRFRNSSGLLFGILVSLELSHRIRHLLK